MSMRLRHIIEHTVALASIAFALTACSTTSHTGAVTPSSLPYSLVINNRSDLEVVVYAVTSPGSPGTRLGSARSFGTSILSVPPNVLQASNDFVVQLHAIGQATHDRDWAFFSGGDRMDYAGRPTRGLALPDGVLRKIFRENALRWIPGLRA